MLIFHSFYVADTRIPAIPVNQDSRSIVPQNIVMLPELKKIKFKEKRERKKQTDLQKHITAAKQNIDR